MRAVARMLPVAITLMELPILTVERVLPLVMALRVLPIATFAWALLLQWWWGHSLV